MIALNAQHTTFQQKLSLIFLLDRTAFESEEIHKGLEGRKSGRPTCSDSGTVGEALSVFAVGGGTVPVYQQILDIVCDEFRGNGLGSVFDGATLYCTGH
jgi:hypothetical protein